MSQIEMTVQTDKVKNEDGSNKVVSISYDFGDSLVEAESKHGNKAVFGNFLKGATIEVQNVARRLLIAGKSQEEIATTISNYKLGEGMRIATPVDPKTAVLNALAGMDAAARAAFLADLKKAAGALA